MFGWLWQKPSVTYASKVRVEQMVSDAMEKLLLLLSKDGHTLKCVFLEVEDAQDERGLLIAFNKINNYFRYLLRVEPPDESYSAVRTALENYETSTKFSCYLKSSSSLEDALHAYKKHVVIALASHLKKTQLEDIQRGNFDRELIQRYFPEPASTMEQEKIKEKISPDGNGHKRRRSIADYSGRPHSRSRGLRSTEHDELRRKNVCIHFQHRKCSRGKDCRFKHLDC